MSYNVGALDTLVEQFERIPGIGHKSAQRMAWTPSSAPGRRSTTVKSAAT